MRATTTSPTISFSLHTRSTVSPLVNALIYALFFTLCSRTVVASGIGGHHHHRNHHLHRRWNSHVQPVIDLMNGPALPLLGNIDGVFGKHGRNNDDLSKRQDDEDRPDEDEEQPDDDPPDDSSSSAVPPDDQQSTTSPPPSKTTATPTLSSTEVPSESASTSTSTLPPMPTVLKPFDTSLRTDTMQAKGCPDFFNSFLNNDDFLNCIPISSLLKTSADFFEISKSLVRLTRTLDDACATQRDQCSDVLSKLADNIVKEENCGADVEAKTPLVMRALNGFLAYEPVRDATCLKSPDTGDYCFADGITNTSSPADANIYYLPLGTALPGGSRPTCNKCLQATMRIFANASKDDEQPMADLYNPAAEQINIGCGPSFVPVIPSESSGKLLLHHRNRWERVGFMVHYALPFLIGVPLLSAMT